MRDSSLKYLREGGLILPQRWNYGGITPKDKEAKKINDGIVSIFFISLIAVFSYIFYDHKKT